MALTCRSWSDIAKDPYVKCLWLLLHYGKAHALFHAIRLGPTFIDIPVCQILIARKVLLSRYFIQRLLIQFGKYDQKLTELKIEHNVGQLDAHRVWVYQQKTKSSWASNLPIMVFTYLLNEGYKQLSTDSEELPSKGNDMELFHFLSAGPHVINNAHAIMKKNSKYIEDLILKKRFIPFPQRPKALLNSDQHPYIHEEYPSKDGFENNRQLNVIARGILLHPYLVNLWKQIGYHEICNDLNDLVMQGALLILFPPTPAFDWACPSAVHVKSRLDELRNLGFKLKDNVIIGALHMFESRLDEIGNILWEAFIEIRSDERRNSLAYKLFREAFKPERNLKKDDMINFVMLKFEYHEQVIRSVVEKYFIEENMRDITLRRKSLILSPIIYKYILVTFGNESELHSICFEDILVLRIYIDLSETPEMSPCDRESIISIFNTFIEAGVLFRPEYLDLLRKATSPDIIKPFFENFLPSAFGMKPISKMPKSNNTRKRKKLTEDVMALEWVKKLVQIVPLIKRNLGELSGYFRDYFVNFIERLEKETCFKIKENYIYDDYSNYEGKRQRK